jgi:hypothetical protein
MEEELGECTTQLILYSNAIGTIGMVVSLWLPLYVLIPYKTVCGIAIIIVESLQFGSAHNYE